MAINIIKQDLRSRRTKKSLYEAMFTLLYKTNFKKLTIKDICNEAAISRATFYAHFLDKYDLLRAWIASLDLNMINKDDAFEVWSVPINNFILQNKRVVKNVLLDADAETLSIVFNAVLGLLDVDKEDEYGHKYIIFSNVLAGGIVHYLTWHVTHNFPNEIVDEDLCDLIVKCFRWLSN